MVNIRNFQCIIPHYQFPWSEDFLLLHLSKKEDFLLLLFFLFDLILPSPGVPYQLDQLANNQPKLSAFFALKGSPQSQDASPCAPVCQRNPEAEESSFKGGTSIDAYLSDVGESVEHSGLISGESDNLINKNLNASLVEEPASSCGKPSEVTMATPSNFDVEDESSARNGLQSSH